MVSQTSCWQNDIVRIPREISGHFIREKIFNLGTSILATVGVKHTEDGHENSYKILGFFSMGKRSLYFRTQLDVSRIFIFFISIPFPQYDCYKNVSCLNSLRISHNICTYFGILCFVVAFSVHIVDPDDILSILFTIPPLKFAQLYYYCSTPLIIILNMGKTDH